MGNPVLRSSQDIVSEALKKSGEPFDGSSSYEQNGTALGFVNEAHMQCLAGGNEFVPDMSKPFKWAVEKDPLILILKPSYSSGTISCTNGNSTITFSAAPTISLARYMFKVDGSPEWFKILAHTANVATATIDSGFTDPTITGATFICALLEYDISPTNGVLRIVEPMVVYRSQDTYGDDEAKIYGSSEDAMLREFPLTRVTAQTPSRFCIVKKLNGVFTVRFNSYVASQTKVEVKYVTIPDQLTGNPSAFRGTVTIASPGVWNAIAHPLIAGDGAVISTTGALPTGFVPGVTYYVVNPTANSFQLSATAGGAAINTSGTQSGSHTITPARAASYPLLPVEHRITMIYMAAYWICEDKGDDRSAKYFALAQKAATAMIKADNAEKVQTSKSFGRLIPRRDNQVRGRRYVSQEST